MGWGIVLHNDEVEIFLIGEAKRPNVRLQKHRSGERDASRICGGILAKATATESFSPEERRESGNPETTSSSASSSFILDTESVKIRDW